MLFLDTENKKDYLLGSGSFKKVSYCVDLETGQRKAVAVCRKYWKEQQEWDKEVKDLEKEAEIMRVFSGKHPNIISFDFYVKTLLSFYFVMEACPTNLLNRADCGSEKEKRKRYLELAQAVQFIHERGFLHRDIKPANVLLNAGGQVKLTDFGFVCRQDDENALKKSKGTLLYTAPEIRNKQRVQSTASDCWALGMTILTSCIGEDYFLTRDSIYGDPISPLIPDKLKRLKEIDPFLENVCEQLLEIEPDKRISATKAVQLLQTGCSS